MALLKIAIGADHRGYTMKEYIKEQLKVVNDLDIVWLDVGTDKPDRSDYPEFAIAAVQAMSAGKTNTAILLCGTGIGMAITANRFPGIYAGLVWNKEVARLAKEDDNCNVLVLPSDFVSNDEAIACITAWLQATFKNGRYEQRIKLIDSI